MPVTHMPVADADPPSTEPQCELRQEPSGPITPPVPFRNSLFLNERHPGTAGVDEPAELAELLTEWRRAVGSEAEDSDADGSDALFAQRLRSAGLGLDEFQSLLAEKEAAGVPRARDPESYGWYLTLDEIRRGQYEDVELQEMIWTNPDGSKGQGPFIGFLLPFLKSGIGRYRDGLDRIESRGGRTPKAPLVTDQVEFRLMAALNELLTKQCSSTLILELNVARLRGQLEGETPQERFRYFSEEFLTTEKVLELLEEYPVLARLLCLTLGYWVDSSLEFLRRLAADRADLAQLVDAPEGFGTLDFVELGLGDLHRGGRSVVMATDVDGNKVVYKPTSLEMDVRMAGLVDGINGLGMRHPLRTVTLLSRNDAAGCYGWHRFEQQSECESGDAVKRFYWRQGAWIAVMHLVRGADFHSENLIASGEHPILVDNEALFHQSLPGDEQPKTAREEGLAWLRSSIARQAILPFIYRLSGSGEGVDSSALSGAGGQVARGTVRRWAEPGTDEMRVVEADLVTQESKNRPTLRGEKVDASAYLSDIVAGFRETYDLLAAHKDALRPSLESFAGTTVRYLLRPTRTYTVFLREGRHPNDLRDGLDRDQLLDRLWTLAGQRPAMAGPVPYEHEDLRHGDIPFFLCRPDSRDLFSSGGERIENFFPHRSLDEALATLDGLSDDDRERQVLLMRVSLSEAGARAAKAAAASASKSHAQSDAQSDAPSGDPVATSEPGSVAPSRLDDDGDLDAELLAAAVRIGEALKRRAIHGSRGVSWVSLDPFVDDRPGQSNLRDLAIAQSDLYHGNAGIAVYLAHLGSVTGDVSYTDLARESLRTVREAQAARGPVANRALGPFVGRLSYSYAYQHAAALWSESSWLDQALSDLPQIEEAIGDDGELDVLSGSAGCLVALLRLHAATSESEPLRLARACGDHLLAKAQPTGAGMAWIGSAFPRPVAGFAHGAAGYAWSLLELAAATGDERYRDAAESAIAFERELLASEDGDDFRSRVSWCHGLPSVALGRVLAAKHFDDDRVVDEINTGAAAILETGPPADSCLCHGRLGNAEILALCGDDRVGQHGRAEWRETSRCWAADVARATETLLDRDRLPLHTRFTGLFCGLAGLGYGLLRFARWHETPSVLTLGTPKTSP